jgi:cytochrome b
VERTRILVWDLPVRVFHWLLALSFTGAFLTAESERVRDIHVLLGYAFLGLLAFRLVWGVAGSRYARFGSFAFGPRAVLAYLRSLLTPRPLHYVGHNPAGSWTIYAMIGLGLVAGASGWAVYDGAGGRWLEDLHEGAANAMLALVLVHLAGVAVSSVLHRENLAAAMLTGYKSGRHDG